jgi:PAS domain S-box-containing protein
MSGGAPDKAQEKIQELRRKLKELRAQNATLRMRLDESEQTLLAIRTGQVDSLVIEGPQGPRIFSLDAELQYRVLIESMNEGAATLSEDGTILYCNACFARMLDLPIQRTMGSSVHDRVPDRSRPTFRALMERALASDVREEMAFATGGGVEIPVYLSLSAMFLDSQRVLCLVATDLREQKRSEALLIAEQAARESELRYRRQYEEAQQAIRARDQLASMVSHDLRNPLAAVLAQVALLSHALKEGRLRGDRLRAGLELIGRAGSRMDRLIDELLDIARLQAGQELELELQETEIVGLVRRLVDDQQQSTSKHRIHFRSTEDRMFGRWDAGRMERVISNLLTNAVKFSPRGGDIEVALERPMGETDLAVLRVKDQGIGIPPQDLGHIFEWFTRGENVAGSIQGSGVGLASARHVVEQHGGTILVQSSEGEGATFTVRIPLQPHRGSRPQAAEFRRAQEWAGPDQSLS